MKRKKSHVSRITLLAAVALVIASAGAVQTSLAYFTTYVYGLLAKMRSRRLETVMFH